MSTIRVIEVRPNRYCIRGPNGWWCRESTGPGYWWADNGMYRDMATTFWSKKNAEKQVELLRAYN